MVLPATRDMTVFTTNYSVEISRDGIEGHANIPLNNKEEFDTVKKLCEDTTNWMTSSWKAVLVPTRTDFAYVPADVVNPLTHKWIYKTKAAIENGKFFGMIGIIFFYTLDVATLPLRLITWIPRAIYNHYASVEHPLIPYLKEKGVPERLQKGMLGICLIKEERKEWIEKGKGWFGKDQEHNASKKDSIIYSLEIADHEIPFPKCTPPRVIDGGIQGYVEVLK